MKGTTLKELEVIIESFLSGDKLKAMIESDRYYRGDHDILKRVRKAIGKNGELVPVNNLPNNKIVDNQFKNVLDQKTDYLLSKELSVVSDKEEFLNTLNKTFNNKFFKLLHNLGKDSYKYGTSYLYIYYDELGKLSFKRFNAKEIISVYKDIEHEELDYVIRIYRTKVFDGKNYKNKTNVEVYSLNGIEYYTWDNGLFPTGEQQAYIKFGDKEYNWEHLPIIPFRNDVDELPLLKRVKSLQDAINEIKSDFKNDMEENSRNTILVIKNYDGGEGTLRHNMNTYGYIPVSSDGGVDALTIEVNSENYKVILEILKKSLIENARGFDAKSDNIQKGTPNRMNIQSMYSDIDLDASAMEREFKESLSKVIWFIKQDLITKDNKNYLDVDVDFVFNKDVLMNETQAIEDCGKSLGIVSQRTILSQHPWVKNVDEEIKNIENENAAEINKEDKAFNGKVPDEDE